jgi:hypothetical protein
VIAPVILLLIGYADHYFFRWFKPFALSRKKIARTHRTAHFTK